MRQEIPGWLAALVIVIVLAIVVAIGWYVTRPKYPNLPVGETPTGQPIYQGSGSQRETVGGSGAPMGETPTGQPIYGAK